jgi:hypothetical protein
MPGAWAVLAAGSLSLSGCNKEEPAPAPPSTAESLSDWVDEGRYATCPYSSNPELACGDEASFDLSGCDGTSLARLPADGIYTMVYRTDRDPPSISAGSFRISADGGLDSLWGVPLTDRRISGDSFFLSSMRTSSTTDGPVRESLVGCRAEGNTLYGCYAVCRNGYLTGAGTFKAVKWERRAGESEASGLQLLSESLVELGLPVDVYVTHGHAYVVSIRKGDEPGGLTVFDVSNPSAPVLKKVISLPTDNYWNGVWSKGNALYVASQGSGVIVFNLANPADPQVERIVHAAAGQLNVHTVFVEGDRLYAMSPDPVAKTVIFDIREPSFPRLLGMYIDPGVGNLAGVGYPHDAFALDGRLYVNHWSSGYVIVDVKDPAHTKRLGAYAYPYATSHANAVGRFGERLIAFEGGENWGAHLRVLDVTDAAHPKRIGELKLGDNASIHNMVLKGERLYLAHYQHGVRVLDVSVPEEPKQVAYYNTFRETDPGRGESFYDGAIGMRVPGDGYVYTIDTSRGLLIFPEP